QFNSNNTDLTYINCGITNFSAGVNANAGHFINTKTINVSGSFQLSNGTIDNYGTIASSSNFNLQNNSTLYNEGKIILNGNNSNLTNVWIKGPDSGKKGYFESNHKLSTNNQTFVGPNLDFKRNNTSSSLSNVFQNNPTFVDENKNSVSQSNANVTFDCSASNSCSSPLVTNINSCPDNNGVFSNNCQISNNTTDIATITEIDTKTLTGTPAGGTFSVVSGGGTINGNIYTPADISSNTQVTIRYKIAANGSCAASTSDVTFTVTPVVPTVTQNFESGDRNLEAANCWIFAGFSITDTDKINGNFSARSGSINSTNGAFRLLSPFIELATGNITFNTKLNSNDNQDYYIEIAFIPFDPNDNNGEGTPFSTIYTHTLQLPNSTEQTISYPVPAAIANDGNPYRVRLSVYNQSGNRNRRAIIDDWSIPGVNVSVPSNNCLPTNCISADNTTSTVSISENETKTLTGNPGGGTFSIILEVEQSMEIHTHLLM
ncbi:MAG: hypothetical protein HC798_00905, partial [Polaribacter sp.]|nr:hypothetical protein [Polaribacter sp.]